MAVKTEDKFFPEYLNQGSEGPPVALLQCLLLFDCSLSMDEVEKFGKYDEKTAAGVKILQEFDLDLEGEDVDGHFGPGTRGANVRNGYLDVNSLSASLFSGKVEGEKFFPEKLGPGDEGPQVALLQCLLRNRFADHHFEITGKWDDETTRNMCFLQREYDIPQTGCLDSLTKGTICEETCLDIISLPADLFQGQSLPVFPHGYRG